MVIGGTDYNITRRNLKSLERKHIRTERLEKKKEVEVNRIIPTFNNLDSSLSSNTEEDEGQNQISDMNEKSDEDFTSHSKQTKSNSPLAAKSFKSYTRGLVLENLAEACDRSGVSDRSASLIVNAVLKDFGLVTEEDQSNIIDRSKIRRERKRCRTGLDLKKNNQILVFPGIYFDGRKDKTVTSEKRGSRYYTKKVTEEHIVIIAEPGSKYLGHVSPISGNANSIKTSIVSFLKNLLGANFNKIIAVGCDGTVVNTGSKNGVIKQIEISVGKSVQWFICLLHANELPLRHLMQELDGKTNDPRGFTGLIGKLLVKCEQMPIVKFEIIEVELCPIDSKELSTDQKYLYEMCLAINSGNVSPQLAEKQPGNMSHSRWLTTANRILRLYVATENVSDSLKILAEFVVKVYATCWFSIKYQSSCKYGSQHLFLMIKSSRYLPHRLKKIVDPVIQRNSYFAHSENILLAMLADSRKYIRELALRRILKCRTSHPIENGIREFKVPRINFEAEEYWDMIDWQQGDITEPPLTKDITEAALREMISEVPDTIDILKFPCHTQAVERHIKMVTEASSLVCGSSSRDGLIRARISSREKLPRIETKKHFYQ
ncbi:unnamed protein product [Phaedon cochleariae]|uniref:Uncharacterized protein n=1 Tax=Phaedon cochleariae TaxID=80249 RepID=A0A9P0D8L7_PHACE|nr:unnamed protein product [Phaedon cochleariae]